MQATRLVATGFGLVLILVMFAGCPPKSTPKEITRERAIEIARSQVSFQPTSIEAEKATENGRPLWRVTFRGPTVSQIHLHGELMIVSIDRQTEKVVSISKS